MKLLIIAIYLLLSTGGLVLIKLGADTMTIAINKGAFNLSMGWASILGMVCYIGSFLLFSFVLVKKYDLTYLMPVITAISQILVILAGLTIFKEHVSNFGIIGILLVIAGIVMLNIK